ncbi:GIY-YIG nuclease superfamily protein [Tetraselmis virus 1]|uniref:GIY-YIG nuclease superfamily protein n=1 Tax=Tetraselmis virus 1 TaxID=2060617 RepID=A0A2P0VN74_9VIRU|nr:GIY-YIG nuclease superfamily protein [Tetraselmis virus 1]AUF82199.1 GIY-YIG nuclease superfamily protein [Tetraselmis virus 1]
MNRNLNQCFLVYVIKDSIGRTYIGKTNDLERRLRQHNKEIVGGARATANGSDWKPVMVLSGFDTDSEALQAEWRMKHPDGRRRSGRYRDPIDRLNLVNTTRFSKGLGWTSNSPLPEEQHIFVSIVTSRPETDILTPDHWGIRLLDPAETRDLSCFLQSNE